MRSFQALLIAAGLAAAPSSAAAGPSKNAPSSTSDTFEKFEWSMSKGRLGVMAMSLTPELRKHLGAAEDRGVLVARVEPGMPASAAGIAVGDVIVSVHGQKVDAASDVLAALSGLGKGQDVVVELVRDRKPIALHAKLSADAPVNVFDSQWMNIPWFGDWMKSFGVEQTAPSGQPEWLRNLRELFQPDPNQVTDLREADHGLRK
jgi:membrane-associated protease RseP (regulator of RpoE activity)